MPKPQFTLYTPVDFDPVKHRSVDNYHGRDELQWQGKYRELGILIIRFELPYKIRCGGCEEYVSMGNRYDAEKRIIGKYHTMSVYKFTMHCHLCLQKWEMRTDPETLDYICMSGCTRKEETWDPRENNGLATMDSEVRKKMLSDKMFQKEYKDDDRRKQFHIDDENALTEAKHKIRKYDYELNGELRSKSRQVRADDKAAGIEEKAFQEKMGMGKRSDIKILPETKEDQEEAAELAKQCIAPSAKANKESIMSSLAKQLGGSRTGKKGNELFDHFKSPLSKRKIGIPNDRQVLAGMVKVNKPENPKPKISHKMPLIPSLSSLGKLGGSKKLLGVIIKKKEVGPKLVTLKKTDFWEEETIGGFSDTPMSNMTSYSSKSSSKISSKHTSNASSIRSNLGVKLKPKSLPPKSPTAPTSKYKVGGMLLASGVKFPKSPREIIRQKSKSSGNISKAAKQSIVKQNSASKLSYKSSLLNKNLVNSSKRKRSQDSSGDTIVCLGSLKKARETKSVIVID